MIESIELNCGPTPDADPIKWTESPGLTIFVGPNNSGKSALLHEISEAFTSERRSFRSALHHMHLKPFNEDVFDDHPKFTGLDDDVTVELGTVKNSRKNWFESFSTDWARNGRDFRASRFVWMGGSNRLSMLPQERQANLLSSTGPLARLHVNDADRADFQNAVFSGLKIYPVIDNLTSYGTFELAFSREKPNPSTERSTNDDQSIFLSESFREREVSDGCRAYTGILGALYSGPYKVVLIDEPEAFLHPPLARSLGKQIAEQARERNIYVATHSADFLMGAVESGVPVRIVRLQYQDGVATACLLNNKTLREFMTDPLLRSANVLSGLFAQSVVVTEADNDRAFYQEVNTRLLAEGNGRGIENAVFLNATGIHTIPRFVELLRKMGIPTVGIVDLDVVAHTGEDWTRHTKAAGIPRNVDGDLQVKKHASREFLKGASTDEKQKNYKTRGGVSLLNDHNRHAVEELLHIIAQFGLFIVPSGELESWLEAPTPPAKGRYWLQEKFAQMGSDPDSADYLHPTQGDVWDFIACCNTWLTNPERRGMNSPQ